MTAATSYHDCTTCADLRLRLKALEMSHFGVLTPAALRYEASRLSGEFDVIVMDIRKMHDGNSILGYTAMNDLVGELVQVRSGLDGRHRDLRGQIGGDEFGFIVPAGAGRAVLARLLLQLRRLTLRMEEAHRVALSHRTGGLVDGLHAAIVLIERAAEVSAALARGVDMVTVLKEGRVTGERSTSGAVGTLVQIF